MQTTIMNTITGKISINAAEYYHLQWPEWMLYLKKTGFHFMEIAVWDDKQVRQVSNLLRQNDITVSAVNDYFHFFASNDSDGISSAQNRLLKDIEHARIMNTDKLIWYTGANDRFVGDTAVNELLIRLEPVLKRASELKVTLLLETEFSESGCDPAASVALLKQLLTKANTQYLAINFDAANLYVAGEEPFPYGYEQLKPWIRYVHLKDVRELISGVYSEEEMKGKRQWGNRKCVCCPLGEGTVNTCGLLNTLKDDRYDGYLSIELHMKQQYQDETLARALDFLKRHRKE